MSSRPIARSVRPAVAGVVLLAWALSAPVLAQRDPTQPPAAAPARGASAAGAAMPALPLAVIVRDGRPHVVVGTRLYAQGERLGGAVIERIDESEIWLREGKTLHKVPRYAGIQRRPAS